MRVCDRMRHTKSHSPCICKANRSMFGWLSKTKMKQTLATPSTWEAFKIKTKAQNPLCFCLFYVQKSRH